MIVSLQSGDARASVSTTGAEWHTWECGDRPLLWSGDPHWWSGRSPLLFPLVGRLHLGQARYADGTRPMPKHGLARDARFEVLDQTADSACLHWSADATSRLAYPFDFSLRAAFELAPRTFTVALVLENTGDADLPYSIGLHPGFRWTGGGALCFAEPERPHVPVVAGTGLFTGATRELPIDGRRLPLHDSLFDSDALCFLHARSRSVCLEAADGSAIEVEHEGFRHWALWRPPGAPLLCIESWTGHADSEGYAGAFADRPSTSHLPPGSRARYLLRYRHREAAP